MEFNVLIHIFIISTFMLIGALLRAKVKFLQKFLIPSSIIGGFFLLVFYNAFAPALNLKTDFLGALVYHLLNITFIAMMLRIYPKDGSNKVSRAVKQTTVAIIGQYGLQVTFALIAVIILSKTVFPDLFLSIAYTLPLGFELGPGQAYSMSVIWEPLGFVGASSVGLTMAAFGFIIGSIGGVILINIAISRGWMTQEQIDRIRCSDTQTGFISKNQSEGSKLTTNSESIDTLTYHLALIFFTYFLSWVFLVGVEKLLSLIGPIGLELANSFWGINFVFSALIALAVRRVIERVGLSTSIDNGTLNRVVGFSVDTTVCASLGAISIIALASYWGVVITLILIGIVITVFILPAYSSRLFDDHQFYRTLLVFGASTGTLPTGLALLRIVDPNFETPVAKDYALATGIVLPFAIPIILTVNLPAKTYATGDNRYLYIALGVAVIYLIGFLITYTIMSNKKAWKDKSKFFYVSKDKRNL
ncbi:MAG: sodium:glutamate symporter [Sphaerochaetaceae bacterium]|nr:sodium:glutamate symporter [Sphaerochaetaceae bacterium]